MITKRLILSLILCLTMSILSCQAQDDVHTYPDFKRCFEILQKNRIVYNQYNDSIMLLKEREQWIRFFKRRSIKNHQLYATNKEVISTITNYFKKDKKDISPEAYESLYQGLWTQCNNKTSDPFLTEMVCNILEDYYQDCPDSLNHMPLINLWKGYSYYEIWSMTKDTAMLSESYEYFKKNGSVEN